MAAMSILSTGIIASKARLASTPPAASAPSALLSYGCWSIA
jgi:hypothetical protein